MNSKNTSIKEYYKLVAQDISGTNLESSDKDKKENIIDNTKIVESNMLLIKKSNEEQQKIQQKLGPNFQVSTFAPNKFIPYTFEQFITNFTGLNIPEPLKTVNVKHISMENFKKIDFDKIPGTEDKTIFYGLSPKLFNKARDQGICGSCWAFSAVSVVEAQIVKRFQSESPPYLSIQYYLDCVKRAKGCEGGFPIFVYQKIALDEFVPWDYIVPYIGEQVSCSIPFRKFPIKLKGIVSATKDDFYFFDLFQLMEAEKNNNLELLVPSASMIQKIKKLLFSYGPLSVLIYVDQKLPFFQNGIYIATDKNKEGMKQWPNHAVVIAGYGMNVFGQDYWIIRNSWGSEWAEDGYIPLSTKSFISGINIPILDDIPPFVETTPIPEKV